LKQVELQDVPGTGDTNPLIAVRREKALEEANVIIAIQDRDLECCEDVLLALTKKISNTVDYERFTEE